MTVLSLMASVEAGNHAAVDALFAARGALGVTSLLHEAYLDLSKREAAVFPDRGRFMAYAAKVMRGLIIDYVRRGQAQKRRGGFLGYDAQHRRIFEVGPNSNVVVAGDSAGNTRSAACPLSRLP